MAKRKGKPRTFKGYVKAYMEDNFQIFRTISEASKALNIDAANIRKVLVGERPKAGGLTFTYTLEKPKSSRIRKEIREAFIKDEHKVAVSAVHDRLSELNQRYMNAKKAGTLESDPVLQKLMSHTDYFGEVRGGRYRVSAKHLSQFTTDELNNLLKILATEEHKYIDLFKKKSTTGHSKAALATIFGVSQKEMAEYDDLVPAMFELIRLGKEDEFFKYSELAEAIFSAVQDGMDEDVLADYMDAILKAYAGNDIMTYNNILEEMSHVDDTYKLPYD